MRAKANSKPIPIASAIVTRLNPTEKKNTIGRCRIFKKGKKAAQRPAKAISN